MVALLRFESPWVGGCGLGFVSLFGGRARNDPDKRMPRDCLACFRLG